MNTDKLQQDIKNLEQQLNEKRKTLNQIVSSCQHKWEQPEKKSEYTPGYYIPGDKELGIEMGVDSQPGYYVQSQTKIWWERKCLNCGKIEKTTETKPTMYEPVFNYINPHPTK